MLIPTIIMAVIALMLFFISYQKGGWRAYPGSKNIRKFANTDSPSNDFRLRHRWDGSSSYSAGNNIQMNSSGMCLFLPTNCRTTSQHILLAY